MRKEEFFKTKLAKKSESTRRLYKYALQKFEGFIGEDIDSYAEDLDADTFKKDLEKFVLKARVEPTTLRFYFNYIRRFFERAKDIKLSDEVVEELREIGNFTGAKPRITDDAGTVQEWQNILREMSSKGRSLYLFCLSSGVRLGEALQLRKQDFDFNDEVCPSARIRAEITKTGQPREVYFTFEARDEILKWLEQRKGGKKRGPFIKGEKRWDEFDRVWPFNDSTARSLLHNALEKTGLDDKDSRGRYRIHPHSTRKHFRSRLRARSILVGALMGHKDELDRAYERIPKEDRKREYREHMNDLVIFERESTGIFKTLYSHALAQFDLSDSKQQKVNDEVLTRMGWDSIDAGESLGSADQLRAMQIMEKTARELEEPDILKFKESESEEYEEELMSEDWEIASKISINGDSIVQLRKVR